VTPEVPGPAEPEEPSGVSRADPAAARPEFVIELWASPQLRERNPGRPLSLYEALEAGREPAPGREPEPDPELEAEP
jgi:hypothetical protein